MPPFWSTIRTSLPRFKVSRDVGSGTRDFGSWLIWLENKWEFCFRRIKAWRSLRTPNKAHNIVKDPHSTCVFICTQGQVRFLNLRHRHQSRGHFEHVTLVISGRGRPQENRILNFVKIRQKIAFYPNRKIFSPKFIWWNVELDERKTFFDIMGTLNQPITTLVTIIIHFDRSQFQSDIEQFTFPLSVF